MSESKAINSGPVTSLADSDLLVACDASGAQLRPISLANLMALVRAGIQVGGRNLIKNSKLNVSNSDYWIASAYVSELLRVGEKLTLTIWGKLAEGKNQFSVINGGSDGTYGAAWVNKVADGVYRGTLSILKEAPNKKLQFYVLPQGSGSGISSIERVKLERGNIATDWSPAPEDLGWGGVNVRYSTTYDYTATVGQKGGQHERSFFDVRLGKGSPDGCLAFGSIDDLCRFIGEYEECLADKPDTVELNVQHKHDCDNRLERGDFPGSVSARRLSFSSEPTSRNILFMWLSRGFLQIRFFNLSKDNRQKWRYGNSLLCKWDLVSLDCASVTADRRKEVAYV